MAARLNALGLPGVKFETATFTPRSIPGVAAAPAFRGHRLHGVRVVVTDVARIEPLEIGMHVLAGDRSRGPVQGVRTLFANLAMLNAIAGTRRLHAMLDRRQRRRRHHRRLASRGRAIQSLAWAVSDLLRSMRLIRAARSA